MCDDAELGSEISGASEEVPNEVDDETRSANYLTSYARNYKSEVLQQRQSKRKYKFQENEEQRLLNPNEDRNAAAQ